MLPTLAAGADPQRVLDTLQQQKNIITNHSGDLHGYLRWALDTALRLRNQITRSDIDRLVFTPNLWRLQDAARRTEFYGQDGFANGLLAAELTERQEAFEQAHAALQAEDNRWNPARYPAFGCAHAAVMAVDTSVFIHHPAKIRDIDYVGIVQAHHGWVRLVVPRVVVDELDRLKESGNQSVRWRAGHTLGVLDELLPDPRAQVVLAGMWPGARGVPRGPVTVEVMYDDPHHVRLDDNDDEIIDRAVGLKSYVGKVRLLTMDTSMALRARMRDLVVHKETKDIGEEPSPQKPKERRTAAGQGGDRH